MLKYRYSGIIEGSGFQRYNARSTPANVDNFLVLTASYKDKGFGNSIPLTGSDYVSLRGNIFTAKQFTNITGFLPWTEGGKKILLTPTLNGSFTTGRLDPISSTGLGDR